MDFNSISPKRINELEQQITQLLKTLRTAKLNQHPIYAALQEMEQGLGEVRRGRYDQTDSQYSGY